MQDKILICSLSNYESVFDFLIACGLSKQYIKKNKIQKNFLTKKVIRQDELSFNSQIFNNKEINPNFDGLPILINQEDERFLVLHKPPGIHGHPQSYDESSSLLNFMRSVGKGNFLNVGKDQYERGLLYRLDFETSGVVVYCKDNKIHQEIRSNYRNFVKKKLYVAAVEGHFKKLGVVENELGASGSKNKKRIEEKSGEKAELDIVFNHHLEDENITIVGVSLKTGLRHQIRFQLSFLGHPIVGDVLYGAAEAKRIFLHAYRYEVEGSFGAYSFESKEALFFDDFLDINSIFKMFSD